MATLDENSLLAKHHVLHNHEIDSENVELMAGHQRGHKDYFLKRGIPCEIKIL